jgi:hypothetical protein
LMRRGTWVKENDISQSRSNVIKLLSLATISSLI